MSTNSVNFEEIQQKLYERLKPSGWADVLKVFLLSEDFLNILKELYKQMKEGKRFTPPLKQLFRAFEECPYNQLKVVFIGQDPYPQAGVADGISFSCSNTGKEEKSLKYILSEVEETCYQGQSYDRNPDLKRWANQGVLCLNTAFTTTIGKIGGHYGIWKPFTTFLFDTIGSRKKGVVYVFLGAKAKEWSELIPEEEVKFFVDHPASAAYKKRKRWESYNLFNNVNVFVEDVFKTKIIW